MDNSKYRRLDYITNVDHTTYIKIPVAFTQDTYMNYVTNILDLNYIGIMDAKTSNAEEVIIEPTNIWYDNNTKVNFGYNVNKGRHDFVVSGRGYVKVDGKELAQENTNKPDWSISYICVGSNSDRTTNQKFIGLVLYDSLDDYNNKNFSHSFVPCLRIEDNIAGVYDLATDIFYPPTRGAYKYPIYFSQVAAIQIPEGNVTKIQDKEGNILWSNINKLAYGIRWNSVNQAATTACERIGNLELHKTLPIQSKFKVCIHKGKEIQYYCNPKDSRFVEESKRSQFTYQKADMNPTSCEGLPAGVVSCEENSVVDCKFINENLFSNYRFLYSYVYIQDNVSEAIAIGRIVYIDTSTHEAYIDDSEDIQSSDYTNSEGYFKYLVSDAISAEWFTDSYTVELGCSINGYDGEIGVDTGGKFYQWSVDNEGYDNEVWISEHKCVPYAKEVKRHIIGCSKACVLNTAFNDTKWGWIGSLQADTAVNVINYHNNLRGGENKTNSDNYLGTDNFRCQLNKGRTNILLATMRTCTQKLSNHQVLYKQLWEAIVWCWCIEYAQLDVKQTFNSALTTDGYRQGGLGAGYSVDAKQSSHYIYGSLTPNDYTLHLGNKTGIRTRESKSFEINVASNHFWIFYDFFGIEQVTTSDKILTITKINSLQNKYNISVLPTSVVGKHIYSIKGLTDSQSIIFKTSKGDITITDDGDYTIDWGNTYEDRNIVFSKIQTNCNITITITSAPAGKLVVNQTSWDVPHWRGFNGFWYGDILINIENFLSKYDNVKQRRIYYWTDDITKFDNTIDNKEHSIEDIVTHKSDWVNEFNLGNQGNLTPRAYGNGKNVYHYDTSDAEIHTTCVGGRIIDKSYCGLAFLYSTISIYYISSSCGFVTCTIID